MGVVITPDQVTEQVRKLCSSCSIFISVGSIVCVVLCTTMMQFIVTDMYIIIHIHDKEIWCMCLYYCMQYLCVDIKGILNSPALQHSSIQRLLVSESLSSLLLLYIKFKCLKYNVFIRSWTISTEPDFNIVCCAS